MGNFKKVLALVVVFVMSLSMVVTASAASVFPDVDSSDDYATAISMLKSLQVLGGDDKGNFNPEKTITRAEFTKILFVLMNGSPDASLFEGPSAFGDVAENAWYNGYINWASNLNIVGGKGNNKFAPQDPVTTQEATKMFVVALTGKSTLAWPYGFVTEAKKANINLYKDATIKDAAKPALRNLIAQLCVNAIFAKDVASFYQYDTEGKITSRPAAAQTVFGLSAVDSVIYETSFESWSLSGIKAIDMITVMNENNEVIQIPFSSEMVGDYVGYTGTVYYKDVNNNGKLDATDDTVMNVAVGDGSVATAKPLNILSSSNTYQLQGISFNPATSLNAKGKLFVMGSNGTVTNVPLTAAAIAPYMVADGSISTSSTIEYGPDNDFDVKVVKDNKSGLINAVYVTYPITFAKVTTLNATTGMIGLDDVNFGVKPIASTGSAPSKTQVEVADGIQVGDRVMVTMTRDFNGVNYTVSPLLVNKNVTMTGIKDDGTILFGDIIYKKNVQVAAAVTANRLPDSANILKVDNLGKKLNVYLDSTGRNYLYAELADATVAADNYVFVKSVNTTTTMGVSTRTMTVVDAKGETKTYTLDLANDGDPAAYLGGATTLEGWTTAGGNAYDNIVILNEVVKLTTNTDGKVTKIESIGATSSNKFSYDSGFKTVSVNGTIVAGMEDSTVLFYYNATTKALTVYSGKDLPSLTDATVTYLVSNLKLKAALITDIGTSTASSIVSRGVVLGYTIQAGTTSGKVKYVITAIAQGSLSAELTTVEEAIGGPIGTALAAAKGGKQYVDFSFTTDGDFVNGITLVNINAGSALTNLTAGWNTGTITASYNGLYAINGVDIVGGKLGSIIGNPVYYTVDANADLYTVNAAPANGNAVAPNGTAANYGLASTGNLATITPDIAYVVVYHTNDKNVIDTAFVYKYISVSTGTMAVTAPTGLAATTTDTSITFNWTAVANAAKYEISYAINGGATTTETVWTNSKPFSNLKAGDVIAISVKAVLGDTKSAAASLTRTAIMPATVPAGLTVASSGAGNLEISWTANAANQAISKYVVSVTVGGVETTYDVVAANARNFTGLAADTYTVKVKAVNANGESAYTAVATQVVA